MTNKLHILLATVVLFVPLSAQTNLQVSELANELHEQLAIAQKNVFDAGLDIEDEGSDLRKVTNYSQLAQLTRDQWHLAMDKIDFVAPEPRSKFLLITILQNELTPRGYLEFLDRAAELRRQNKLDDALLNDATFPQGRLIGLLADNYKDLRVRAIAIKLRDSAPDNKELTRSIAAILSGARADGLTVEREFDTVPRVSLAENKVVYARPTQQTDAKHMLVTIGVIIPLLIVGAIFFIRRLIRRRANS